MPPPNININMMEAAAERVRVGGDAPWPHLYPGWVGVVAVVLQLVGGRDSDSGKPAGGNTEAAVAGAMHEHRSADLSINMTKPTIT